MSPSSAGHDASLPARAGAVLELGEGDLVRPSRHSAHAGGSLSATVRPDGPAEPTSVGPDREESAPRGTVAEPVAEAGANAPEPGSGDLGDLARSFLDASVASDEEAAKSADAGDDEEVEVFRSWLRSLKK